MSEREYFDDDISEDNLSELNFDGHFFHDDSVDDQEQALEDYFNMLESGVDDSDDSMYGFHIDQESDYAGDE